MASTLTPKAGPFQERVVKQYGTTPEPIVFMWDAARFEPVKDISTLIRGFA
jgi:hypothetical protein